MIIESEATPLMIQISTGKHKAMCKLLDVPIDATGDTIVELAMEKITLYDIYHRGVGWIESQVFKHDAKKKGGVVK